MAKRKTKGRNKGGRPRFQPTADQRSQVQAMAAYGTPHVEIARVVGIDHKTMYVHFRDELDLGATKANARVAESLFRMATGYTVGKRAIAPIPTAAIFWMKVRCGWKETTVNEVTGKDGGPIAYAELSDERF